MLPGLKDGGRFVSAAEAVSQIQSGDRVYVHGMAAAPQLLLQALVDRASELRGVRIAQPHTEGPATYADRSLTESFRVEAFFVGSNVRAAVNEGRADYIPIFLSEVPALFRSGEFPIDVALIQVSPPDRHGFCSMGTSIEISRSAVLAARQVVAQVNPQVPRTHGDGLIHVSEIDFLVPCDDPIFEHSCADPSPEAARIGERCAELVEDGATLQLGIGAIPNAALAGLGDRRDLGIHSEMISDGILDLVERGVINGRRKVTHPGKIVASFAMGSRRLYDFLDDNPQVAMLDIEYVNDSNVIRRNPKVVAINSAIEVDLTGQVCADSIGTRLYSGVGGQMDFMRGAAQSVGGKPIIALPSQTAKGVSRIVTTLNHGAGVVTTRAHVHYVVTEFGAVNLHGMGIRQRVKALIGLAHPDHRERLEREATEAFGIRP
ncbi:MAG: acetyl-CoA hydrolase/transferase family protein [Fimbriimonas sp.]